jgi:uncharacterized protein YndB with AHSA1/START domain
VTTTKRTMAASVDDVWAVLADARSYPAWVVGAKEVRSVDAGWPDAGTRFEHTVGAGPFTLDDNTKSLVAEPPHRLVMEARGRPLGRARIELVITSDQAESEVTMSEHVVSPMLLRCLNPLLGPVIRARNVESLRRLSQLVEPPTA